MNVLIAGGGPTGAQLASLLLEQRHEVCLVEHRPEVLSLLHSELPTEAIYEGSATDLAVLEDAGIRRAGVFVACTSNDADNLVLCALAQTVYRVPRTIGRINNPRHAWLFDEKRHVSVALNESSVLAHLIEEEMSLGDMMTLLKLRRGRFLVVEAIVPPGARADGAHIRDLPLPEQCVIVAVIRQGGMVVPRGPTVLHAGDEVLAITDPSGAERLSEMLTANNSAKRPPPD